MAKSSRIFAVHPGEILKTEFLELTNVSACALAKVLSFPGTYEVVCGDRAISADTAIRPGKHSALPAQFWLNLQGTTTCGLQKAAESATGIKPRKVGHLSELTGTR